MSNSTQPVPDEQGSDWIQDDQIEQMRLRLLDRGVAATSFPDVPTDEELVRFADGTLMGRRRKEIQAMARQNLAAAMLIGDFVRQHSAVRGLCQGWLWCKGPILASLDSLPENVTPETWKQHTDHCPRSRWLTGIARVLLAPVRWVPTGDSRGEHKVVPLRVAIAGMASSSVLALTFFLLLVLRPPRIQIQTQTVTVPIESDPADTVASKGSGTAMPAFGPLPDDDAETLDRCAEFLLARLRLTGRGIQKLEAHCLVRAKATRDPNQRTEFNVLAVRLEQAQKNIAGITPSKGGIAPALDLAPEDDAETLRARAEDLRTRLSQTEAAFQSLKRHSLRRSEETHDPAQRTEFRALADRLAGIQQATHMANDVLDPDFGIQKENK